jgi:hypothetical protein
MTNLFQDTLVNLIGEYGKDLLNNAARLSALLNDHTKGQCKRDIRVLSKILEYDFHHTLQSAGDNFVLIQQQFAQKLYDDDGLEINTVKYITDILAIAIGVKDITELDRIEKNSAGNETSTASDYYEYIELFDFYLLGDTIGKDFVGKYRMSLVFKKYSGTTMCFSDYNGDKFRIKTNKRYDVMPNDSCCMDYAVGICGVPLRSPSIPSAAQAAKNKNHEPTRRCTRNIERVLASCTAWCKPVGLAPRRRIICALTRTTV